MPEVDEYGMARYVQLAMLMSQLRDLYAKYKNQFNQHADGIP